MKHRGMNEIKITTRPNGACTEVQGHVGPNEVMSISSRPGGAWMVGSSSCLPADPLHAALYIECMRRVMDTARQHGAPLKI